MSNEKEGYTRTISTAEFSDTPRVSLEQPVGDVHVEGWDRPEVQVSCSDPEMLFEIEQSGSDIIIRNRPGNFKLVNFVEPVVEEAKGFGINLDKMDLERAASRVERKVERSMRRLGKGFNVNLDIGRWMSGRDYNIKVPHTCHLTIRTSSGDIRVNRVNGTLLLQSTSGDVNLQRSGGNALLSSSSGEISISDHDGKLGVRSASGDVRVGSSSLREVSASTASGDVSLELTTMPEREWELKTVSGDLKVHLPADAQLTAQVRTLSGDINCGFQRSQVTYNPGHGPGRGRGESTLVINGGGLTANFITVSGDVNVKPNKGDDNDREGQYTANLSRLSAPSETSDITEPEGYAARRQSELDILQAVERGDITSQEAMQRLGELSRD